jgi:orotidine-5'-phosphate decarboxylase
MTTTAVDVRDRLALALDVDDLIEARRLSKELKPYFNVVKVGLELFTATGPDIVAIMRDQDYKVLLDLKLHDIPNTVGKAARVLGSLGVSYMTAHAFGGTAMLRAAVEGANEGAARADVDTAPKILAVTILTSDAEAPPHILGNRVRTAMEAGCAGIVCAASDVREAKQLAPRAIALVPGIRPAGVPVNDQKKTATPQEAMSEGADLLVIGRAVTQADNKAKAAEDLLESLA